MAQEYVLTHDNSVRRVPSAAASEAVLASGAAQRAGARDGPSPPSTQARSQPNEPLTVSFQHIRNEVTNFGARHLDSKKEKKSFEQQRLEKLGFQSQPGQRMGRKVGQGMAQKAQQRANKTEQELIDAGMRYKSKSKGKRKSSTQGGRSQGGGLKEAKNFRPGLMRVSKSTARQASISSSRRRKRM